MPRKTVKTGIKKLGRCALAALAVLALVPSLHAEDRPMFGRTPARTHALEEAVPLPLSFDWAQTPPAGQFAGSPLVVNGVLYIASEDTLYRIDAQTGSLLGSLALGAEVFSEPTYFEGHLYLGTRDGRLMKLLASNLATSWSTPHGGDQLSTPLVTENTVIISAGYPFRDIRGFDRDTGLTTWSLDTGQIANSSAALLGNLVYVQSGSGPFLALRPDDGTVEWTSPLAGSGYPMTPAAAPGVIVFAAGDAPSGLYHVTAVTPSTGNLLVGRAMSPATLTGSSSPAVSGGTVYLTQVQKRWTNPPTRGHILYAVELSSGNVAWSTPREDFAMPVSPRVPNPVVTGSTVYAAFGNILKAWNAANGTPLAIDTADWDGDADPNTLAFNGATAIFATPALANGRVYVVADDGMLYAFQSANTAPSVPDGLSPSGGSATWDDTPTLSWNASTDPEEGSGNLSYLVEVAFGQEPEFGADRSGTVTGGATSWDVTPAIPVHTHVYWRVRAEDANKAQSAWSATGDFWVRPPPPDPPASITALPLDGAVRVIWDPSPSASAVEYFLYFKLGSESWSQATRLAPGLAFEVTVNALANNMTYDFMVTAADQYGFESTGVADSAVPRPPVTLNDDYSRGYASLEAAGNAAAPGDAITLGIGTFVGAVTLPPGVSLRGYAPHLTVVDGAGAAEVVTVDTSGSDPGVPIELSRLAITGGTDGIVFLEPSGWAAQVTIANVLLYRLGGDGIDVVHSSATVVVENITAVRNGGSGMELRVPNAVLRSSVATNNGGYGFRYASAGSGSGIVSRCNNAWGNAAGNYEGTGGQGCLSGAVAYRDEGNDDYRLFGDAVSVDRGDPSAAHAAEPVPDGGRANQGAFGSTEWAAATEVGTSEEELLLALGAGSGGWMELFGGASAGYAHQAWRRLPWSGYNQAAGETRAAAGDLNGNGRSELVVGTGSYPSSGGWLAVMHEGASGNVLLTWLRVPWAAYNNANGETWPACGDTDGDGRDELVVGLGPGSNGWFCVFDDEAAWFAFLGWKQLPWGAYNTANGEVRPSVGDVDGDGRGELCLALGAKGYGWLALMGEASSGYALEAWRRVPWGNYVAREEAECWAAPGDVDGDGLAEVVVGLGPGGAGWVWVMEDAVAGHASSAWIRVAWNAYSTALGEVRPACWDVDGDGRTEVLLGLGQYPQSGGWLELKDDGAGGYAHRGWMRARWSAYNSVSGGTRPVAGNWR